jgi:hypothetical protein
MELRYNKSSNNQTIQPSNALAKDYFYFHSYYLAESKEVIFNNDGTAPNNLQGETIPRLVRPSELFSDIIRNNQHKQNVQEFFEETKPNSFDQFEEALDVYHNQF